MKSPMSRPKPPINPALTRLKPGQWKETLKDVEGMAEDMRSEGLDAQVVHPMLFRYAEYEGHHGPGFMLSAQRWEEITTRAKDGKLARYDVFITPKGWMRAMVIVLYSDGEKLAFLLPLQIENRQISYMKKEASEKMEMWLHLYNVQREYLSIPLYGALAGLGHEDDSAEKPVPVDYPEPEKSKKSKAGKKKNN